RLLRPRCVSPFPYTTLFRSALLLGERLCRCAQAGVVVSEVEAAPPADDLVDDGCGIVFRRRVDDSAFGGAALGADGLTGLFDSLGGDIGHQDLRSCTRECDRTGSPDAASGSSDESVHIAEIRHNIPLSGAHGT